MSFMVFSIDFPGDEFYVVVEAEDAGDEQEGLGDVDEQSVGDVVDHHYLVGHQGDAADDEQHRAGVLRDFESRVFHVTKGRFFCYIYIMVASPAAPSMAAMM